MIPENPYKAGKYGYPDGYFAWKNCSKVWAKWLIENTRGAKVKESHRLVLLLTDADIEALKRLAGGNDG